MPDTTTEATPGATPPVAAPPPTGQLMTAGAEPLPKLLRGVFEVNPAELADAIAWIRGFGAPEPERSEMDVRYPGGTYKLQVLTFSGSGRDLEVSAPLFTHNPAITLCELRHLKLARGRPDEVETYVPRGMAAAPPPSQPVYAHGDIEGVMGPEFGSYTPRRWYLGDAGKHLETGAIYQPLPNGPAYILAGRAKLFEPAFWQEYRAAPA